MKNFTYYFKLNGSFKKTIEDISGVFINRGKMWLIGNKTTYEMNEVFSTKINVPYNMSNLRHKKYQNHINKNTER